MWCATGDILTIAIRRYLPGEAYCIEMPESKSGVGLSNLLDSILTDRNTQIENGPAVAFCCA